jgi:putative integral membrane protein (TIGR02587 family)
MLVADVSGPWLIVMMIASLVLSYGIVFQANFTSQGQRRLQTGLFQSPSGETIFSYLVSLVAAALMLAFFRQIDLSTPWDLALSSVIVLGLPATIGGAAGRLAL